MMLTSIGKLDKENESAHWPNLPTSPRTPSINCSTCTSVISVGYRSGSSRNSDCHSPSMRGSSLNKVLNCCQSSGINTNRNSPSMLKNRVNTSHTATTCGKRRRSKAFTNPCIRNASTKPVSTGANIPPRFRIAAKPNTNKTASTTACSSEK